MNAHFAEVLTREKAALDEVRDAERLNDWRHRIIDELMNPTSPYACAMRQTADIQARARFLDSWRRLIARTIDNVLKEDPTSATGRRSPHHRADTDPHKTAVLILAALHGGATLSRVAEDPWPLNAALDIALAPLTMREP